MTRLLIVPLTMALMNIAISDGSQADSVGDKYEINQRRVTKHEGIGSSGNTNSGWKLIEEVIAVGDDTVGLRFDRPESTPDLDRERVWQYPVTVSKPPGGSYALIDRNELEERVDVWLERWGFRREACGRWIFTWSAYKIECDPGSILEVLQHIDFRDYRLSAGAEYGEADALEPVLLEPFSDDDGKQGFVARMQLKPDAGRRWDAEREAVKDEIFSGKPVSLETARRKLKDRDYRGTITTTFEVDETGRVIARLRVTVIETLRDGRLIETYTIPDRVTRIRLSPAGD